MRILIADDVRMTEKIIKNFFKGSAHLEYVECGRSAIDTYTKAMKKGQPFDLIILDILMPNIDGISTLKHIRKLEKEHGLQHTLIMMLTSVSDVEYVVKAKQLKCDSYLLKPIHKAHFMDSLKKMGLNIPQATQAI